MFEKPTVFILGAGASWHYGYPTGQDLVPLVVDKANELAVYFNRGYQEGSGNFPAYINARLPTSTRITTQVWEDAAQEARLLARKLTAVNPTLIDYFLAQNEELQDIGRLAIAMTIFECEAAYHHLHGNPNHHKIHKRTRQQGGTAQGQPPDVTAFDDDWLRFVLHQITVHCPDSEALPKSEVSFVTFNYDLSVEKRLFDGLTNISFFKKPDIAEFFTNDRFMHVYGSVRDRIDSSWAPMESLSRGGALFEQTERINKIYAASQGIRTIDGSDKIKNSEVIERAIGKISGAHDIYILGFGFDASNCSRLNLHEVRPSNLRSPTKYRRICFTNFNASDRVSRAAGKVLADNTAAFSEKAQTRIDGAVNNRMNYISIEMSSRNVYGALARDFDLE